MSDYRRVYVYIRTKRYPNGMNHVEGVYSTLEYAQDGVKLARLGKLEDYWSPNGEDSWEAVNSGYHIRKYLVDQVDPGNPDGFKTRFPDPNKDYTFPEFPPCNE